MKSTKHENIYFAQTLNSNTLSLPNRYAHLTSIFDLIHEDIFSTLIYSYETYVTRTLIYPYVVLSIQYTNFLSFLNIHIYLMKYKLYIIYDI